MGLILALALILSYIESLFPFFFGVPGMKLGLANLAVVLILYMYGAKEAFLLNILRVLLAGFLFGNLYMILYSLAGAILSFIVMVIVKRTNRFSIAGVSMAGGVFHNVGQALVAMVVIDTLGVLYYLPPLLVAGVVTGGLIGFIAGVIKPYIERVKNK
jgi:heptaprenyl diphosphate synthase